jgi:methionyl-tRNA formyltransferase
LEPSTPSDPPFGLVLLTQEGIEHAYVARHLAEAFPQALHAVIVPAPQRRRSIRWMRQQARRWWRRYTLRQLGSRTLAKGYQALRGTAARRAAAGRAVLFGGASPPALPGGLVHRVASHNGPDCLALLDRFTPDVIAVYGTDIIRAPVFQRSRLATVNMHTGLSPAYRGSDTVFWPLHDETPDQIGVTIHLMDAGVDSGPILATGKPRIAADDDEHSLFFKCVRTGTPLYIEAIRSIVAGTANPEPQALETGRSFRFVDRTFRAERRVERLLRKGLLRRHAATG